MQISWRGLLQTVLALGLTILGVLFFRSNAGEMRDVIKAFQIGRPLYLVLALMGSILVVYTQASAMRLSYLSLEHRITLRDAIVLYLKRFFLSPFIPGGFSVAQYTLKKELQKYDITPAEHAFASSIYVLAGICGNLILLVPATFLLSRRIFIDSYRWNIALILVAGALGILICLTFLLRRRIAAYARQLLASHIGHFHSKPILKSLFVCVSVEVLGMIIFWCSSNALHLQVPFEVAAGAYLLSILVITISPLFQGLVVVEGALVYFLAQTGVSESGALAAALIYRGFQLWLPLLVGGALYIWPFCLRHIKKDSSRS
jgi:phosphatidylglycerol lysyltransferase